LLYNYEKIKTNQQKLNFDRCYDTGFSSVCIWIRCSKRTIPMKVFKIMIGVECVVVLVAIIWLLVVSWKDQPSKRF